MHRQFTRTHTASREYVCNHCGEPIRAGETYRYVALPRGTSMPDHRYHDYDCTPEKRRSRRPTLPQRGWVHT